ncbi:MAG TPA: hypothetical protein VFS40_13750 [Gemmatimonadales bacterium]|nr:hypothetical protein [Gemmatimonadales bacterium]
MQRIVWRHFAIVLGLLLLFDLLWMLYGDGGVRPSPAASVRLQAAGYQLPFIFVRDLPLAAGLALALLELRRGALRTAVTVVGLVLAVMVVFDVWARPALEQAERLRIEQAEGTPVPLTLSDTAGVLQRAVALARHRVSVHDVAPKWRPESEGAGSPYFAPVRDPATFIRMETALTATAAIDFFLPFVMAGLVLGLGAWTARRVVFRHPRDGRLFRVVAAWIVVFFTTSYVTKLAALQRPAVYKGASPVWIFAPLAPALVIAGLGWRAAARAVEDAEP